MARTRRILAVAALVAVVPVWSAAEPATAEPSDVFGDFLRFETQLPGLRVTEPEPSPAAEPDDSVKYLADRDLLITADEQLFVVFDTQTLRVLHEESVANGIESMDVSDDGSTLVVAAGLDELIFYDTANWSETRRLALPADAPPAFTVAFAPGTTDVVLLRFNGLLSVVDGSTVAVPTYIWEDHHPFDLSDAVWGNDEHTLYVLDAVKLHEVDITTGTPAIARSLTVPQTSPSAVPRALSRFDGLVASEWGWAVDPVTWRIVDEWDEGTQHFGRRGSDSVIVRTGADVELRRPGLPSLRFAMPEPFGTQGRWMIPLSGTDFIYTETGGQLRFGDAELLASASGDYTAVTPERIFDTRVPIGQPETRTLAGDEARAVQVAGTAGVPAEGVSAVVVNVTAVNASEPTFVSVFPTSDAVPEVSNVNLDSETAQPGAAVANLATVQLADDGTVTVYNRAGTVDVILDVMGYYSDVDGPDGGRFVPLDEPRRIADTRRGLGSLGPRLGAGTTRTLDLNAEMAGNSSIAAAVLHVTAINPAAYSFVTVYPGDVSRPEVSNINLLPARTSPNLVIVRVPADGMVDIYHLAGSVDIAIDLMGWYEVRDGPFKDQAGRFLAQTPRRTLDTRQRSPFPDSGALPPASEIIFPSIGSSSNSTATADFDEGWTLVMNLTAVSPTAPGFLAAIPTDATSPDVANPTTSNVNFMPGQVRPNHAFVTARPDWSIYNSHGYTHALVDVFGYLTPEHPQTSIPLFAG